VLLLRGEAGIGKTALLEYLIGNASDLRVLRAVGVESQMELAFASLHQLCAPMLDRMAGLPTPQRDALAVVFGMSAGPAPEKLLVGLAALSLLSEVAEERPLLCVVDDAQWLDQASAQILAFVARRLLADPVGLAFAARDPGEELRGLPELEVQGLPTGDARALLGAVVRIVLDARVRDRLVAETGGNPLALLELPRGLSTTQLAAGFGLLGGQALSRRIEASFRDRLEQLPLGTKRLLLVAAAEPAGDPLVVWRAAERLGIEVSAAVAADTGQLLTIGEQVTFRHPLVRSAVYRSASPPERRAVHLALAEVTDPEIDPERRAWHLAAAAPGPDEEVAVELERSAGRAQARGGLAAAAAFLQRSVALTREPARRAERALAAAQASLIAGAFDAALGLLSTAEAGALDELQRARVDLLRGQISFASMHGHDAPPLLLKAAKRMEPLDPGLARETYRDAFYAATMAGPLARSGGMLEVAEALRASQLVRPPSGAADLLLDGLALLIVRGPTAAVPTLKKAVAAFREEPVSIREALWLPLACAGHDLWDGESWSVLSARLVKVARDAGALSVLPIALASRLAILLFEGEFAAAAALSEESDAVSRAMGSPFAPYGALVLATWRGRQAEAVELIDGATSAALTRGEGQWLTACQWASAVLFNGLGHFDRALSAAAQFSEYPLVLGHSLWALVELIEAAAHSGKAALAEDALRQLSLSTRASGSDWGLGIEARSRALLSEGVAAEGLYREAVDRLGRTRMRPDLARARLLYGEWLRRENRRVDAREQLRTARQMFDGIGMEAFAQRAERELSATGARARKRTVETIDELTAQELRVAQMARDGLSNPEIGARLFISPRTVKYHLQKVFTKLEISSRGELHRVLPRAASDALTI
jgi:DNA-binding CsgD family transcriptional regulator